MIEEDNFIWKILSVIGIRISEYSLKPYEKYLSYIIVILSSLFLVHWILVGLHLFLTGIVTNVGNIALIFMPIELILFWYFLYVQKESISIIKQQVYNYRNSYRRYTSQSLYVRLFVFALFSLPGVLSLLRSVLDENEIKLWTFGYKVQNKIAIHVFTFYVTFMYYFCNTAVTLVAFSLNIVFYRCREILIEYNNLLNICLRQKRIRENIAFLKKFFIFIKILQNLDQALSFISFIVIFYGLEMIFVVFLNVLVLKAEVQQIGYIMDAIFNCVSGFFILIIYTLSSSFIPEKLTEIRKTAKYFIIEYSDRPLIFRNTIIYLKRIEKEDIMYIRACGMFSITRQLILSAVGVTVTYGLLIINFNNSCR